MKSFLYLIFANVLILAVNAQSNSLLTNSVAIGNRGVSFCIKDETSARGDEEVSADAPLSWVLSNTTRKDANVHWEGIQRTFSLKLLDDQGHEVSLTDYGKYMNSGPFPLPKTGSIHLISLSPGQVSNRDFPALTNLFQFSKPGDYTFEARYWYIEIGSHEQWKLSDPVRLKVVKHFVANNNEGPATNAPSN